MPLLSEMPVGRTGVIVTSWAMRITLLGVCVCGGGCECVWGGVGKVGWECAVVYYT